MLLILLYSPFASQNSSMEVSIWNEIGPKLKKGLIVFSVDNCIFNKLLIDNAVNPKE